MSVDVSASLRYGWFLQGKGVTDRMRELAADDFEELNGKYEESLGHYYVSEIVEHADVYNDDSPYCIGIDIKTDKRIYDEDGRLVGFRSMTAEEFASEIGQLGLLDEKLRELYVDVTGEEPKHEPTVHLYESWW